MKSYLFEDFLKSHVVVKSDKDGLAIHIYLSEANAQMNSKSGDLNIYECLGNDDATKTHWSEQAKMWQTRLHVSMIPS